MHLDQSGEGLAIAWKVEKRPLRQKLGPLGERVRTVRRVGYRYVASDKSEMSGGA